METTQLKENCGYLPLRVSYYVVLALTVLISVGAVLFYDNAVIGLQRATAVADVDAMDRFGDILMGRMAGLLSVLKYAGLLMAALLLRGTVPAGNRRLGRLSGWLLAVACCLVVFWGASNAFPGMSSLVGWGLVALVVRCLALLSSVAEVVVLLLFGLELARLGGRRFKDCGMLLCMLPLLVELSTAAWYAGPAFSPVLFGGVYLAAGLEVALLLTLLALFRPLSGAVRPARDFRGAALAACVSLLLAIGAVVGISAFLSEESLEGGELTDEEMIDEGEADEADTYDPDAGYSDGGDFSDDGTSAGEGASAGSNTVDGQPGNGPDPADLPEGDLSVED